MNVSLSDNEAPLSCASDSLRSNRTTVECENAERENVGRGPASANPGPEA